MGKMVCKYIVAAALVNSASAFVPSTVAHRPFLNQHNGRVQMAAPEDAVNRRDLLSVAAGIAGLGCADAARAAYGDAPKFGFFGDASISSPYDVEEYNTKRVAGVTGLYKEDDKTRVATLKAQIDESVKRLEATRSDMESAKWDSARADIRRQTYPLRERMLALNEYDGALREKNGPKADRKLQAAVAAMKEYQSF